MIIMAAFACFRDHGLRKTTIVDIARAADVSRSTFYEYFRDKETVVEACAEVASQRFYRNMAKAIDRDGGSTLEDRLVRAAVFVTQARQVVEPEVYFDQEEVNLMLTKNAATLLRECAEFIAPYISAARVTGEVRSDLDITSRQSGSHGCCSRSSLLRRRTSTSATTMQWPTSSVHMWFGGASSTTVSADADPPACNATSFLE